MQIAPFWNMTQDPLKRWYTSTRLDGVTSAALTLFKF